MWVRLIHQSFKAAAQPGAAAATTKKEKKLSKGSHHYVSRGYREPTSPARYRGQERDRPDPGREVATDL